MRLTSSRKLYPRQGRESSVSFLSRPGDVEHDVNGAHAPLLYLRYPCNGKASRVYDDSSRCPEHDLDGVLWPGQDRTRLGSTGQQRTDQGWIQRVEKRVIRRTRYDKTEQVVIGQYRVE